MRKYIFILSIIIGIGTVFLLMSDISKDIKNDPVMIKYSEDNGWAGWNKTLTPIYSGPFHLVGDPSVIKDGSIYRMFYNCYDPVKSWGAICQVTSTDGINWTSIKVDDSVAGRMIQTSDQWDTAHETPFIMKYNNEYFLYFTGYRHKGGGFGESFPYYIGLATSKDGIHFTKYGDVPILKPTKGGYDSDAVFSPSIVEYNGHLVMIYTGFCITSCDIDSGIHLLAATSEDGKKWTKVDKPIIDKENIHSATDGIGEADIVLGPDKYYYLFMTLFYHNDGHEIGIARSTTPFGPWEIDPSPIIKKTGGSFDSVGPIAPSVIIENDTVRMWFHGFGDKSIDIGYAKASWPLRLD